MGEKILFLQNQYVHLIDTLIKKKKIVRTKKVRTISEL